MASSDGIKQRKIVNQVRRVLFWSYLSFLVLWVYALVLFFFYFQLYHKKSILMRMQNLEIAMVFFSYLKFLLWVFVTSFSGILNLRYLYIEW